MAVCPPMTGANGATDESWRHVTSVEAVARCTTLAATNSTSTIRALASRASRSRRPARSAPPEAPGSKTTTDTANPREHDPPPKKGPVGEKADRSTLPVLFTANGRPWSRKLVGVAFASGLDEEAQAGDHLPSARVGGLPMIHLSVPPGPGAGGTECRPDRSAQGAVALVHPDHPRQIAAFSRRPPGEGRRARSAGTPDRAANPPTSLLRPSVAHGCGFRQRPARRRPHTTPRR